MCAIPNGEQACESRADLSLDWPLNNLAPPIPSSTQRIFLPFSFSPDQSSEHAAVELPEGRHRYQNDVLATYLPMFLF